MKRNMSIADRLVRAIVAALAAWLAVAVGAGTAGGIVALVLAGIMTRAVLPYVVRSHDWLCTVGRTVEIGTPVTTRIQ